MNFDHIVLDNVWKFVKEYAVIKLYSRALIFNLNNI